MVKRPAEKTERKNISQPLTFALASTPLSRPPWAGGGTPGAFHQPIGVPPPWGDKGGGSTQMVEGGGRVVEGFLAPGGSLVEG